MISAGRVERRSSSNAIRFEFPLLCQDNVRIEKYTCDDSAGPQIAFAFFLSVFQGFAPDTDLDKVRGRHVGILFELVVTAVVFRYIWPECAGERVVVGAMSSGCRSIKNSC